jgi:hypothetical protein
MESSEIIMDISAIMNISTISQIETFITDYNENIRYYNRNIRDFIELYRDSLNEERQRRIDRQRRFINTNNNINSNTNNNINSNTNNNINRNTYRTNTTNRINNRNLRRDDIFFIETQFADLQDVLIRPSSIQIETATQQIQYDISMTQTQCPISLEPFQQGDIITRIRHCGHSFYPTPLNNWFQRNVRCPVCRYDIRLYTNISEDEPIGLYDVHRPSPNNNTSLEEELSILNNNRVNNNRINNNRINNNRYNMNNTNLYNIARNLLNTELNRNLLNRNSNTNWNNTINDLFIAFDIPLEFDISYNYI